MHVFLTGGPYTTHIQTRIHIEITYKCTYIHTNTRKITRTPHAKYTRTPDGDVLTLRVLDTLLDTLGSGSEAGHGEL